MQPGRHGRAYSSNPLTPATDDLTAAVEPGGKRVVVESLGGQQNHLTSLDLKKRHRIPRGSPLQLGDISAR
jgi:hypothetical protein